MLQGTFAKGCLNVSSEKHHPDPSQPSRGLGRSGRHHTPDGTRREEDEGLEIAGWVFGWPYMSKEQWEDPMYTIPPIIPHRGMHCSGYVWKSRFLQQHPSDKGVLALLSPPTINPCLSRKPLPYFPLLWNKRSVQGMPKCNWIKTKKKKKKKKSHPLSLCSSYGVWKGMLSMQKKPADFTLCWRRRFETNKNNCHCV